MGENRNIVRLQWIVITVILVGAIGAVTLMTIKAEQYKTQRDAQNGNVASLREQVRQAHLSPTPTVEALPEAVSNGPTPTPSPTATPKKR